PAPAAAGHVAVAPAAVVAEEPVAAAVAPAAVVAEEPVAAAVTAAAVAPAAVVTEGGHVAGPRHRHHQHHRVHRVVNLPVVERVARPNPCRGNNTRTARSTSSSRLLLGRLSYDSASNQGKGEVYRVQAIWPLRDTKYPLRGRQ